METTTSTLRPASAAVLAAQAQLAALEPEDGADSARTRALALSRIVATLAIDDEVVLAGLAYPLLDARLLDENAATERYGAEPVRLARELRQLGHIGLPAQWRPEQKLSAAQAETLRKMLLAIVTDPRLIILRLADQLLRLREAKELAPEAQRQLALETREIHAPLANRLGVWQLKWELEDLSFRYLDAENYRRIAGALKVRRADRERYIDAVIEQLQGELAKAGIDAQIVGRPKHIFSIWKKMERKQLTFEQVLDVRALRVLVDTIADCYGALGVVHGLWPYIPGAFDDYIATPKDNFYRSLHTAVFGPGHEPVEVQIRTREMHEHAELGVAAHWKYKEGGQRDAAYEAKIRWVRQLLEPEEGSESERDFLERFRAEIFEDRIYVLTPKGEVIDLPKQATPLDFAYHVHTDLGHRCRGAKVNGRMVPLDYQLQNGEIVEVITARNAQPSRDWLNPHSGFLASPRSRAKVRAFFRKRDETQNRTEGREILERELERLGARAIALPDLISELGLRNADALYAAIGAGDIHSAQIAAAVQRRTEPAVETPRVVQRPAPTGSAVSGVTVERVGNLLSNIARCCRPVPPEPIAGYITLGRGVSIHRSSCASLLRLKARQPERIIQVAWGEKRDQLFPADIAIDALDRRGLVRDVSAVLADEKISIERMNTVTNSREGTAHIALRIAVHGLEELSRVLARMSALPNVVRVRRTV
ncbi:MAG TPA: bifunctional (p)ppGpp synthetase/guanosine-3',5'-bis(diphosphate) 3'-pyrophosphohydrolase [Steroidobacteraceae bacterium]